MDNINLDSAQTGDVKTGDIAGNDIFTTVNHVYNVTTALEQVTRILSEDVSSLESRLSTLEVVERHHANERAALTRTIIMLSSESATVKDLQKMLESQMSAESEERTQRRRHLDNMLILLIILTVISIVINIYQALRRSGRAAKQ